MKTVIKVLTATAASVALAPAALAQSPLDNNMTNIVTVVDACDMAAIGVDFGVISGAIGTDVNSAFPNTTVGNTAQGNGGHPDAGADGAGDPEDGLALNTGIGPADTAISTALSTLVDGAAGVFVACTTTPDSLVVSGANANADLPVEVTGTGTVTDTFDSELEPSTTNAGGAEGSINYTLQFTSTIVSTDLGVPGVPALYTGAHVAVGTIPAATNADTKKAGFYTDVAVATLTF